METIPSGWNQQTDGGCSVWEGFAAGSQRQTLLDKRHDVDTISLPLICLQVCDDDWAGRFSMGTSKGLAKTPEGFLLWN